MEEESTQKSDDNSLNEAGLVENVEDQEDLNSKTLEETEHKSESEGKGRVKLMSKKIFVVGLALFFFLWWCLLGNASNIYRCGAEVSVDKKIA
ncbi:hypothetical protein ACOSQ2_022139 [Xanthoceras sorbifolium]